MLLKEYRKNLQKLKINREKIPLDILKSRYGKSYTNLLMIIKEQTAEVLKEYLFDGLLFQTQEELNSFCERMQESLNQKDITVKEISYAAFKNFDADKVLSIAEKELLPLVWEAYRPCWESHCITQGVSIHNELIHMEWDAEKEIWVNPGEHSFMVAYPPPTANSMN